MLFLLFKLGKERYALSASRVVEVLPLVDLKQLPQAPNGVAGVFNYRGRPVPALDLCALTLGHSSSELLSTRIIIVNYPGPPPSQAMEGRNMEGSPPKLANEGSGADHLLGL